MWGPPPVLSLWGAYVFTLLGALSMVGGVSLLRARGWATPLQGRKLMHISTGPVYVVCWLLFPSIPSTPSLPSLLCSTVPLLVAGYMFACSLGVLRNRALVSTVSRSGDRRELQKGPTFYGIVHCVVAATYWTHSPTGIVILLTLCVGDGVADLVGRPFGRRRWAHNREKSVEGSAAFFVAALAASVAYVSVFEQWGVFKIVWPVFGPQVCAVVAFAALVESCPLGAYDNVAVAAAVAAGARWYGWDS